MRTDIDILRGLYAEAFGSEPEGVGAVSAAGSARRYYRLVGTCGSAIGTVGTDRHENEAFVALSRHLRGKGLRVPEVLGVSGDGMAYLQEDLGDVSLFDMRADEALLVRTVEMLPDFQWLGAQGMDWSVCHPVAEMDEQAIMWDLNYFKYSFLNTTGTPYAEAGLERDFRSMARRLAENPEGTLMLRDFQSRNVMVNGGAPWVIDFQGARRGPWMYDLVSFVCQARAAFPEELRERLREAYIRSAERYVRIDREAFRRSFREYSLLRLLQVLGAYGLRGRFEGKVHFLRSIPGALRDLKRLLEEPFEEWPELSRVLAEMVRRETTLTVTVGSFSYMKGYPEDTSGNGGGFVFDCRAIENPGRYERYRSLTGRDAEVKEFLQGRPDTEAFMAEATEMVMASVRRYRERGFTALSVWFGCTGGQHRSVYGAERLAGALRAEYGDINIRLVHREQGISEAL